MSTVKKTVKKSAKKTAKKSAKTTSKKSFTKGESVAWSSSQGEIEGKVVGTLTKPIEIKGHHVAASAEHPEILVESTKTGAKAAHKPSSLRKK